jgi:hypothetical protein
MNNKATLRIYLFNDDVPHNYTASNVKIVIHYEMLSIWKEQ